ncbi:MAG: hypothetical protein JXB06_08490 [Spirochaetales bacterium]|nr:hypothetical protein [Spirochaetales bacterium]
MSRIERAAAMAPAALLLIFYLPNWWPSLQDRDPHPLVLAVLLAHLLLVYLLPFAMSEVLVLLLLSTPALASTLHGFCGLPVLESYLVVARCALAVLLYFLLSSIIETYKPGAAAPTARLLAAAAVAFLWTFVLMGQSMLFSLSPTILTGLLLLYRRKGKIHG